MGTELALFPFPQLKRENICSILTPPSLLRLRFHTTETQSLVMSLHLLLSLPSRVVATYPSTPFFVSLIRATCPFHFILFDLIAVTLNDVLNKL
jgi:hypothetical protein